MCWDLWEHVHIDEAIVIIENENHAYFHAGFGRTAPVMLAESNYAILVELLLLIIICAARDVAGRKCVVSECARARAGKPADHQSF